MGQRPDEMNRELGAAADATNDTDDPAEIRAEIEQTRSQMGETIDAIQARLNPQHLGEQVKEQVREQFHEVTATVRDATIGRAEEMVRNAGESITEARYGLMETIKHNPVPAAMAAIGLGWLFMGRRSAPPRRYDQRSMRGPERYYGGEAAYAYRPGAPGAPAYGYQGGYEPQSAYEREQNMARRAQSAVGDTASQARDAAGNLIEQARDTVGGVAEQARDTAGQLAGQAQSQVRRAEDTFQSQMYENPLGVAAVALALGAAVGFGLPRTEHENRLMGEARDNLVEKAQEVAQDTVEKVQRVAGDVAETAQQTAREGAREQGLSGEKR